MEATISHTTEIGTAKITDIAALMSAVQDLQAAGVDCQLVQNASPRLYYSGQGQMSDYVLKLNKSKYDVGFSKSVDKTTGAVVYTPVTDLYANEVGKQIGATCAIPSSDKGRAQHAIGKLMQGYAGHAAVNAARMQGHMVERTYYDDKGNMQIVIGVNA